MWRRSLRGGLTLVAVLALVTGCRPDEPALDGDSPETRPPLGEVARESPAVDAEALRREADEADRIVLELRNHIARMRAAPTPAMRASMNEHRAQLQAIEELIQTADARATGDRTIRSDHLDLAREELRIAQAEVQEMERGSESVIQQRMPAHLDRLDRVAAAVESYAAELRRP